MKIKFKHRADNYFWVTALLIFITGTLSHFFSSNSSLDINIKDTYYVMDCFLFARYLAFLFFILGFIYWALYRLQLRLNPAFTKLHTKASTGVVFIYLVASPVLGIIARHYIFGPWPYVSENLLPALLLIFAIVQPLLIANIIMALAKGKAKQP